MVPSTAPSDPFSGLPRVDLAVLPTPLQELNRLARDLGLAELLIKRDDLTGLAEGGNKTRKLEFIIAEALQAGAESVITVGALQSNHCRQTAAAAARYGLRCTLVLIGQQPEVMQGNLLLDTLLGARTLFSEQADPALALKQAVAQLDSEGETPFVVPYGGTSPAGMAAFALALRELQLQHSRVDRIVLATSSGGTQAGLAVGAELFGFEGKITGISVDRSSNELAVTMSRLANDCAAHLGLPRGYSAGQFDVSDRYLGRGYAAIGDLERSAISRFARTEGILLDPVYTGRAAGGMIDLVERGEISAGERVVFWHTGGTPALFAYPPV